MTRTLGLFLAASGLLLWIPSAWGEGVDAAVSLPDSATDAVKAHVDTPVGPVHVPALAPIQPDMGDLLEDGLPGAEPDAGSDAAQSDEGVLLPIPAAAERATFLTGLAVLAGLAAYAASHSGAFVPLFSRITSNHLLDNNVRQRVHDAVGSNPGITIKEIAGLCGIGWGTAVYHLKRLESERLIVSERQRQFRRYFKNGGGIVNDAKAAYGELKHPTGQRIAQSIVEAPGTCQKDLCARVGISPPLAHKYLVRLVEAGLVETQRAWKSVKYFPTPKLQDLLDVRAVTAPTPTLLAPPPVAVA